MGSRTGSGADHSFVCCLCSPSAKPSPAPLRSWRGPRPHSQRTVGADNRHAKVDTCAAKGHVGAEKLAGSGCSDIVANKTNCSEPQYQKACEHSDTETYGGTLQRTRCQRWMDNSNKHARHACISDGCPTRLESNHNTNGTAKYS